MYIYTCYFIFIYKHALMYILQESKMVNCCDGEWWDVPKGRDSSGRDKRWPKENKTLRRVKGQLSPLPYGPNDPQASAPIVKFGRLLHQHIGNLEPLYLDHLYHHHSHLHQLALFIFHKPRFLVLLDYIWNFMNPHTLNIFNFLNVRVSLIQNVGSKNNI